GPPPPSRFGLHPLFVTKRKNKMLKMLFTY
ncbi:MAG: hypothetical protein ACI8ZB_004497, partial [Desulforhopalus sp.]